MKNLNFNDHSDDHMEYAHLQTTSSTLKLKLLSLSICLMTSSVWAERTIQTSGNGGSIATSDATVNNTSADIFYWDNPALPNKQHGITNASAIAIGNNAEALSRGSIVVGTNSTATSQNSNTPNNTNPNLGSAVVIGTNSYANGNHNTIIGNNSYANGIASTAIGREAVASDDNALAIGTTSAATAEKAIAIGQSANASGVGAIAFGSSEGGSNYYTDSGANASGDHSLAVGTSSVSSGTDSVAIGHSAQATKNSALAFGDSAIASAANATAIGQAAKASGNNAVAVGDSSLSSASNSVAIGQSAKATNTSAIALGDNALSNANKSISIGQSSQATNVSALAIGDHTIANAAKSVAIGQAAHASKESAAAFGDSSNASGVNSIALGSSAQALNDSAVALGSDATASANNSVAIGQGSISNKANAVAIGSNAKTDTNATKIVNTTLKGITFGNYAGQVSDPGMQVSFGNANEERQLKHVGSGEISKNSTDAVNGSQLYATNNVIGNVANSMVNIIGGDATLHADGTITATNIGNTGKDTIDEAVAAAKTKVVAGLNMEVSPTLNADGSTTYEVATSKNVTFNSVHVGNTIINQDGINAGGNKITNVANGTISSSSKDAVNGSQLYHLGDTIYNIIGAGSDFESGKGPTFNVAGNSYYTVGDAILALDNEDKRLQQAINKTAKRANAGIAAAMALEPAPYIPGKWTYALGTAYHSSEVGFGATLKKTADNGRWSATVGVAGATEGKPSVRLGIGGAIN
ncbi:hypothetical protein B9T31_06145 [Acinetobacter sp. ANC 4558]|uniref:YadA-like family protein n=1 Tax=Acinetobacter sp. ANC 4558 TaxID=1977876 RepID=UPI000A3508B0|nr:YadA-like family protein [Acinetobacter sp. ANC 4558]OTG86583.1 hypothetical protein B9T31_06145 [Acinetobacter sp. ANC 4558]